MAVYKQKKNVIVSCTVIFTILTIAGVYFYVLHEESALLVAAVVPLIITILIALVPPAEIITDENGIKSKKVGRIYQSCRWNWIYDVKTFRLRDGNYATLLSYSQEPEKRSDKKAWIFKKDPGSGIITVSAHFADYTALLKEIKEKATNSQFDGRTEKIITEGIRMSSTRKIFWIMTIFFFVYLLFYFVFRF